MKIFAIFLCCFAVTSAEVYLTNIEARSVHNEILKLTDEIRNVQRMITVDINDYVDNAMQIIQSWIIKNGLDPIEVPDVERSLGIWPMRIKLILDSGWMQGLSYVERGGDATMNYEAMFLNVRLPFAFPTVLINYDYKVLYGLIPQTGGIEGKIHNLRLLIDFTVDTKRLEIILQDFQIVDAGKITLKFSGNPLIDWISNLVSGAATKILHGIVINIVEHQLKNVVIETIDQLNQALHPSDIVYLH